MRVMMVNGEDTGIAGAGNPALCAAPFPRGLHVLETLMKTAPLITDCP